MSFLDTITRAKSYLEQQGRVSLRALRREFALDDDALDELVEELVDVQQIAMRDGAVLVSTQAGSRQPAAVGSSTETRKTITVIFADLMGSTALQEGLDPESVNRVMDAYYEAVRGPVEAAGGTVVQLLGDGVFCAFGIPRIAEDDALRAVHAAVKIQVAFREFLRVQQWLKAPIGLRVAVNTGEVVVSAEHPAGIGDPLNVAARLQQEARDGEVLIGQATRRLVSHAVTLEQAGVFALKGRSETVTAYRVVSLERPTGATAAAFVGREDELGRLIAVYERALAKPAAALAVVLGSPGLGKSRLIGELTLRLGAGATVLTAQCDAAGGATFAPMAAALRAPANHPTDQTDTSDDQSLAAVLPADYPDRARIVSGLAALRAGSPASPEETFFVIRRFLTALARDKPVVLVIDDLHWAEPLLLDLVEHLIQWGSGVPLFIVVGARPELHDLRSSLVTAGGFVADVVTLTGLDAGAAMRLAANAIGAADLPAAVAAKVLATSEGNPLFVSELVRMLVQEGALTKEGDRWIVGANLASFEMPPTIHALLAARIERLRPEERTVLEHASVVGRHFSRGAVAALSSVNGSDLDARLEALRRTELIEPDAGWFLGEPMLRFHHVLIRDAAYRRLLKGTRAELHQRLADWIESKSADAAEHDETIGWHLEQAYEHLRELGPIEDAGKALGERASRRLAAAGRRALAGDDAASAGGLIGRAIACVDAGDPARADFALDWCEALLSAGDVGAAATAIDELGRLIGVVDQRDAKDSRDGRDLEAAQATSSQHPTPSTRLQAWHTCFTGQLTALTEPQKLQAAADAVAAAAEELAALHDDAGEAKAHSVHAQALARLGKVGACEAALDKALAAARKAGDRRRANAVLAGAPVAALWGPSPVTRASGRCLDVVRVLRITQGAPAVEAVALSCQGVLEALRGRTDAARRMIASSRKMVEELGIAHRLFEADVFAGRIDLLEGDAAAAERHLRGAYEGLRDLGLGIDAARAGALLARARLAQGAIDEAEMLSHESEALAGDDLQAAIAWRGVRAEALAGHGDTGAAVELAQAAVSIASATDALLDHADACLALAATLRAAGRQADADIEERRAIELWEAKGATLLAERARLHEPSASQTHHTRLGERNDNVQTLRRVRANQATTCLERFDQVVTARDADGLAGLLSEQFELTHHVTGLTYGRRGMLTTWRSLFHAQHLSFRYEALATMGDSLLLHRHWVNADRFAEKHLESAGAIELEEICVTELDESGLVLRFELFAFDHLGDAIARLYTRHAERQPDDPPLQRPGAQAVSARTRAATTAAAVGAMLTRAPDGRLEDIMVADLQVVDHRTVGIGPARGSQVFPRWRAASDELADDQSFRVDDVLALSPNALLRRTTQSGTIRASGGVFETTSWALSVFGADGRQMRFELFDVGREADALARLDVVATEASPTVVRRRVRPNAASLGMSRVQAAFKARDFDNIAAVSGDPYEEVHHLTGTTYTRTAMLASVERFLRLPGATVRQEHLATLGDTLLLHRRWMGASAAGRTHFDVGEFEKVEVGIIESDGTGASVRHEIFSADRLGDAIVRLYERYAELLTEGAARTRAAATACAVAAMVAPPDLGRYASALAPDVEFVDHRTVGFAAGRGADRLLRGFASLLELAENVTTRVDDVLAVEPGAMLLRWMTAGTDRASGGRFESSFLLLWKFGDDGLVARDETFDAHREAEALSRFEALTAIPSKHPARRRVGSNQATATVARFDAACAALDLEAAMALLSETQEETDHPTGAIIRKDGVRESLRSVFRTRDPHVSHEVLATLGDSLMLLRRSTRASGSATDRFDVGAWERDEIGVVEVDHDARIQRSDIYNTDQLGDAIVRMYELYAEQLTEGPARLRASVTARAAAYILTDATTPDPSVFFSPTYEDVDHRNVGYGKISTEQAQKLVESFRALAGGIRFRVDDVLALRPDGFVRVSTTSGVWRDGGGAFERTVCMLTVFGPDGRTARQETFESDREIEALARFDELLLIAVEDLTAGPDLSAGAIPHPDRRVGIAATRARERVDAAFMRKDWDALRALAADGMVYEDRRHWSKINGDADLWVKSAKAIGSASEVNFRDQVITTAGERIELRHRVVVGIGPDGGDAFESEFLLLTEVDVDGKIAASINFDVEARTEAVGEMQRRFALALAGRSASSAPVRFANAATRLNEAVVQAWERRDWDALRALHDPAHHTDDRRRLMHLRIPAGEHLLQLRMLWEVPHSHFEITTIATRGERLVLSLLLFAGQVDDQGGALAIDMLEVVEVDAEGRLVELVLFDPDDLDTAYVELDARWLAGEGAAHRAASTGWAQRFAPALQRRDWDAVTAVYSPSYVGYDHRLAGWGTHDRPVLLKGLQEMVALAPDAHMRPYHVRTTSRGSISDAVWVGTREGGAFESPFIVVTELDADGLIQRQDFYDPQHLAEAQARFAELSGGDDGAVPSKRTGNRQPETGNR